MLAVESLLLLLTRPDGDQTVLGLNFSHGLKAALIADLVIANAVTIDSAQQLSVVSRGPLGHPVLDYGLSSLTAQHGRKVEQAVRWGRFNPEPVATDSLIRARVWQLGPRRLFGFGAQRLIEIDPSPRSRLRRRLADVFAGVEPANGADATIIAALHALECAPQLLLELCPASSRSDLVDRLRRAVYTTTAPGSQVAQVIFDLRLVQTQGPVSYNPHPR